LEAIAIQPASNWGHTGSNVVPEMIPLFKEEAITFGGKNMKYRLHVPENIEAGRKYPMILWLHGAGETGDDNKLQLVHLHHIITSLTGEKKRDFFLLVPQQPSFHSCSWGSGADDSSFSIITAAIPKDGKDGKKTLEAYKEELIKQTRAAYDDPDAEILIEEVNELHEVRRGGLFGLGSRTEMVEQPMLRIMVTVAIDHPLEFAFAMVDQVIKNYPVDTDRITVSGLSTGGDGTWRALERRPELFAAAVPLVSWRPLTDEALEKSPILKKVPIWAIYSSDDNGIDTARAGFDRVEKAGCNVKKTEFGICGHSAWTPAMLQADIFNWLLSRSKKGGEYIQVFDPGVNPDDLKGIVDVATRDSGKPALAPAVNRELATASPTHALPGTETREALRSSPLAPSGEVVLQARVFSMAGAGMAGAGMPPSTMTPEREYAYTNIAQSYFRVGMGHPKETERKAALESFMRCVQKMSPQSQAALASRLALEAADSVEGLAILEGVLDRSAQVIPPVGMSAPRIDDPRVVRERLVEQRDEAFKVQDDDSVACQVERIIEECNRPWAMTTQSLYGLFPADWDKEAQSIPDFVVNSTSEDLAKILAKSVGSEEPSDFLAACKSIMSLQNKPMSSPWFETSGGRLRSEITYSLSAKGETFVRFLRAVKDSGGSEKAQALSKAAQKTLEKIDMVLAKE
jgi:predicted esterase